MNPAALVFFAVSASIGALIAGTTGALVGFVAAGTVSLVVTALDN